MASGNDARVGLQINLAPMDVAHASVILPHQLRALGEQVDDIVLSLDSVRNRASRYRTEEFDAKRDQLMALVEGIQSANPRVRLCPVDYSAEARREISQFFGGVDELPVRAADGSPFHAYLHGMHCVAADYVLHLDSDLFLGGGSPHWVREAVAVFESDDRVMAVNPLPGPPTREGTLRAQVGIPYRGRPYTFQFGGVSTRVLMIDKRRFGSGELRVPALPPELSRRIRAAVNNTPPVRSLEGCLSGLMDHRELIRVDLLGADPGLWSLHPDFRSPAFYAALPELVDRVERGDIPEGQRGFYDVTDDFFDWSQVRSAVTWRTRLRRNVVWARAGVAERLGDRAGSRVVDPRGGRGGRSSSR